jgi:hypothetical protein
MKCRMVGGPNEDDFFRRWKLFLVYNLIVIWVIGQLSQEDEGGCIECI